MKKILLFVILLSVAFSYSLSQSKIKSYTYFFDNDSDTRQTINLSSAQTDVDVTADINTSSLHNGYHLLHIYFTSDDGKSTVPTSRPFFKNGNVAEAKSKMRYWFDDEIEAKKEVEFNSADELLNLSHTIDAIKLTTGYHDIAVQFSTQGSAWSNPYRGKFFKAGGGNDSERLITTFQYWFNDNINGRVEIDLSPPSADAAIDMQIDIPIDAEYFRAEFIDNAGFQSVPYNKAFIADAEFEVFSVINTFTFKNKSTFATSYSWSIDNKEISTTVHPSHTFSVPGLYDICLIATNKLGSDTMCKVVEVRGLREITAKEGGNKGMATIFVYGGGLKDYSKVWLDGPEKIEGDSCRLVRADALRASFDLNDKKLGVYDVHVKWPDGSEKVLPKAYTVVEGTEPEPYVEINGRSRTLFGRWQTYTLNFGNKGNTDALCVPLYMVFSNQKGFDLEFKNLEVVQSPEAVADGFEHLNSVVPLYTETDSLFGEAFNGKVYYLYIPSIPAGFSGSMKFRIKSDENLQMYAWVNDPMYSSDASAGFMQMASSRDMDFYMKQCIYFAMVKAVKDGIVDIVFQNMPGVTCVNKIVSTYMSPTTKMFALEPKGFEEKPRPKTWRESFYTWGNKTLDLTGVILSCASELPPLKAYKMAVTTLNVLNDVRSGWVAKQECREKYRKLSKSKKAVKAVSSLDPNEIVGPQGYTSKHYVSNKIGFPYTIFFENKSTATAPAQEVFVADTLDPTVFDFSTFAFGSFTVGDDTYTPLAGLKEFTLDIDLKPAKNIILRVNAKFDINSGIALWYFTSLDPLTMDLTEDPDGGFLPPNKTSPEGEGNVKYSIQIKTGLAHMTRINNRAEIIFDLNKPIMTNDFLNTLDLEAPASKMLQIAYTPTKNVYRLDWSGEDFESGIENYIIYVSKNDSAYAVWKKTKASSGFFKAEEGQKYKFFSLAIDNVGHAEEMKALHEVSTDNISVNDYIDGTMFSVFPNPSKDHIFLGLPEEVTGSLELEIYDNLGIKIKTLRFEYIDSESQIKIPLYNLSNGSYIISINHNGAYFSKKFTIIR